MSDLVTLAELKVYLGEDPGASANDAYWTALLDDVEALFESATLLVPGSYRAAGTATEVFDGTGSRRLYLTYPVASGGLTSVKLGYDSTSPTETLNVASRSVIVYGAGSRCISRVDGGKFGCVGQPRYVEVVYTHLGDLPDDAHLPIMEVVAAAYRGRGSEGMKSETVGDFYSYTRDDLQTLASSNANWQQAVNANMRMVLA